MKKRSSEVMVIKAVLVHCLRLTETKNILSSWIIVITNIAAIVSKSAVRKNLFEAL